jgi:hypothetical protein
MHTDLTQISTKNPCQIRVLFYSLFKAFTGFTNAAFIPW